MFIRIERSIFKATNNQNWTKHPKIQLRPHFWSFRPFLNGLNHNWYPQYTVSANLQSDIWLFFPVSLVKINLQKSNKHQMNHWKIYFLAYFITKIQKVNMVSHKDSNVRAKRYGGPCNSKKWLFRQSDAINVLGCISKDIITNFNFKL